jgi:hypothetical protein
VEKMTKVANTKCPITMLILQNKPNFPCFSLKNVDLAKKRTQTNPIKANVNLGNLWPKTYRRLQRRENS